MVAALAGAGLAVAAAAPAGAADRLPVGDTALRTATQAGDSRTLARTHVRLTRTLARVEKERVPSRPRLHLRLQGEAPRELRGRIRNVRRDLRQERAVRRPTPPHLKAIAACESGGNYRTDTGNGFYGAYQFNQGTWESVGGSGNPADAPRAEQDKRAAKLYAREGASPWPVCGS